MEKLSKITVKHFININLKESKKKYAFFDEEGKYTDLTPPFHPLYVKVTFRRATTQMKSIFGLDFGSVEEAKYRCEYLLDMEQDMITDVITHEYKKLGEKFNLVGLAEKCKPYGQKLDEFFAQTLLINEYNNIIELSHTPYEPLLLWKSKQVSASVYYSAAIKLLGELPELIQLKDKIKLYDLFKKATSNSNIGQVQVIKWVYDDARDDFGQKAFSSGLTTKEVNSIAVAIDKQIEKIL